MFFIDTHTHLYLPHFRDDIDQVIQNAADRHVIKMLLPNIDCKSIKPMLDLCEHFPHQCHPMLGLHPTKVKEDYRDRLSFLESLAEKEKFVAIGETGMDAYWSNDFLKHQEDSFIIHLDWAKHHNLPVVIHTRKTMDKVLSIIRAHKNRMLSGVFHAFSGSVEHAMQIVDLGFKLGIGGIVTYKNSGLKPVIQALDLKDIILETDSPYLTPAPNRGNRNESANIHYIAQKISEFKNLSIEQVALVTSRNASELFNLKIL